MRLKRISVRKIPCETILIHIVIVFRYKLVGRLRLQRVVFSLSLLVKQELDRKSISPRKNCFLLLILVFHYCHVYKTYLVAFAMKEIHTAYYTFKDAVLSFMAKFDHNAALLFNKTYQAFRFVYIQTIIDERPGCPNICFYQCTNCFYKIL